MKFTSLPIKDALTIEPDPLRDERGFFARFFDKEIFEENGIPMTIIQSSISSNSKKGTIRGLHHLIPPHEERKLVTCTHGSMFDVLVDLRKDSPTHLQWVSIALSADSWKTVYVPPGVAHGFQTLEDNTIVFYQISINYDAKFLRGVRWDDPTFGIKWPLPVSIINARDSNYPFFPKEE